MLAIGGDAVQITPNQAGGGAFEAPDGSIYYNSVSSVSSVWRMPPRSGDAPVKVIEGVIWFNYSVLDKGIYYIDRLGDETRLPISELSYRQVVDSRAQLR